MSSERDWARWGDQDPYYGVLSCEKFRANTFELHKGEFFESGVSEVQRALDLLDRLYGTPAKKVAVDFGCGVGRLSIPLSRRYERVIGIDVSPGMLAEAEKNCAQAETSNITFCSSPDDLASYRDQVDLVLSRIVLQHIPSRIGIGLISKLLSLVSPRGVASLHVTTKRQLTKSKELVYRVKHRLPFSRYLFNVAQGKRWNEPLMQMNDYPLDEVVDLYLKNGMTDIFLELTGGTSRGFIVYGRKA
jgi:trans-aconitate methyltransferase